MFGNIFSFEALKKFRQFLNTYLTVKNSATKSYRFGSIRKSPFTKKILNKQIPELDKIKKNTLSQIRQNPERAKLPIRKMT